MFGAVSQTKMVSFIVFFGSHNGPSRTSGPRYGASAAHPSQWAFRTVKTVQFIGPLCTCISLTTNIHVYQ